MKEHNSLSMEDLTSEYLSEPEEDAKEIIERFSLSIRETYSMAADIRNSSKSNLVWIVGIAGFVLINIVDLLSEMMSESLSPEIGLLATLPWVFTAFSGAVAHIKWLKLGRLDIHHYNKSIGAIDSFLALQAKDAKRKDVLGLLNLDDYPEIKEIKNEVETYQKSVDRWENLTHYSFLTAFVIAFAIPAIYYLWRLN